MTTNDLHQQKDRSWWNSRAWLYTSNRPATSVSADPEAERWSGVDPRADPHTEPVNTEVETALSGVTLGSPNRLSYRGQSVSVRPIAARLLQMVRQSGGRRLLVADVSQKLWGRRTPPCRATLNTTIFRANAAFRASNCRLRISCRAPFLEVSVES